jgi:hypothetical protein
VSELSTYFAAVKADFAAYLPQLRTVSVRRPDSGDIETPAILIDMEFGDIGEDVGDGRDPVRCRMTAHCVLSVETPQVEIEVREFAVAVARRVRRNKFGMGALVDFPEGVEVGPGEFRPGKKGFDSWCVSWEQTVYLGDDVWAGGTTPGRVFVGVAPFSGEPHIDKYVEVDHEPAVGDWNP